METKSKDLQYCNIRRNIPQGFLCIPETLFILFCQPVYFFKDFHTHELIRHEGNVKIECQTFI